MGPRSQTRKRKIFSILVVISLVGTISGKLLNLLRQMSHFKNKLHVWNSLPADRVDFSSFAAFKQTIEQIDFSQFLFGYDN